MPAGVNVMVDNGFATIDFVDRKLRGPALNALVEFGGAATVQKLSREKGAPRDLYKVPEGNARAVGLLDEDTEAVLATVIQSGGTDATGMVNPEGYTVAEQAHGPVVRVGTYRGGIEAEFTKHADPVATGIAAPTHADVVATVGQASETTVVPQGVPAGSYPAPDKATAYIGMQGTGEAVAAPAAPEAPTEPEAPAEPVQAAVEPTSAPDDAAKGYPDGTPNDNWRRSELDAYALAVKGINTTDTEVYGNKAAVLAVVK